MTAARARNTLNIARSKSAAAKEELRKTQDRAIRQVAKAYDMVKSALAEYDSALALVTGFGYSLRFSD